MPSGEKGSSQISRVLLGWARFGAGFYGPNTISLNRCAPSADVAVCPQERRSITELYDQIVFEQRPPPLSFPLQFQEELTMLTCGGQASCLLEAWAPEPDRSAKARLCHLAAG